MAPQKRRPPPLEEPPTASSSSEDSRQPPTQQPPSAVPDDSSSSEEGDQSSSQEAQPSPIPQHATKTPPPPTPTSNPKSSSSESESGSGSGSGSESGSESEAESEPEPTPPPKPLASKPMKAQPQAQTQTQAQVQSTPVKSGTKRVIENENDSKRAKKKTTATTGGGSVGGGSGGGGSDNESKEVKAVGEDSKKGSQRLFSEEDELAILKGLADFISKTGKDPMKEPAAFHSFVKKLINADATGEQLKRKIRGLKKKFETSSNFSKPHDKKAFELFKKVWGNDVKEPEENGKVNGKNPKSPKKDDAVVKIGSLKKEVGTKKETGKRVVENGDVTEKESGKGDIGSSSAVLSEMARFDDALGLSGLSPELAKKGFELMGEANRAELEKRWKEFQIAEMELFVRRVELIKKQSSLILEAYKKPNH